MLKSFFNCPNVLLRLLVVLVFAGGLVFAGTFDGFVPKIQAESCCGGTEVAPTDEPVAPSKASGCCGSATDTLLADGTVEQPQVSSDSGIDASVANYSGKDCECTKNNCPAASDNECGGCSNQQQDRCRSSCPINNACNATCKKNLPSFICNGAKQCSGCGASSC